MRLCYLILICFITTSSVYGQTFHAIPDSLLEKEVRFEQANECIINFENPGGDSLHLHWRLIESNVPEEWDIDLCDYGSCYIGIPSNGLMNIVHDTIQPYLKLIVQPGMTPGTAWIWFRVYEEGFPENKVDVYFSLYTPGALGTIALESPSVFVYPNPAYDALFLNNYQSQSAPVRLINANGQLAWQGMVPLHSTQNISLLDFPIGLYVLHSGTQSQKVFVHKK